MGYDHIAMPPFMLDDSNLTPEEASERSQNPTLWAARRYGQSEHMFRAAGTYERFGYHYSPDSNLMVAESDSHGVSWPSQDRLPASICSNSLPAADEMCKSSQKEKARLKCASQQARISYHQYEQSLPTNSSLSSGAGIAQSPFLTDCRLPSEHGREEVEEEGSGKMSPSEGEFVFVAEGLHVDLHATIHTNKLYHTRVWDYASTLKTTKVAAKSEVGCIPHDMANSSAMEETVVSMSESIESEHMELGALQKARMGKLSGLIN